MCAVQMLKHCLNLNMSFLCRPFHVLSFLVAKFSSVHRCSAIPHVDLVKLSDVHAGVALLACLSLVF